MRHNTRLAGVAALLLAASPAHAVAPCAGTYLAGSPAGTDAAADPETVPPATRTTAKLELKLLGRFTYSLTRGEHEETAEGRWRATDDRVVLTGDPVVAPAFTLEADEALAGPALNIDLELPNGLSRQFFAVVVRLADGTIVGRAFTEAPFELATSAGNPAVSLRIDVPQLGLSSHDFTLARAGAGNRLRLRFAANDLGKVAFADTPLIERDGALILPQPGGELAFRREGRCSAE